jgi:hypothetical protein
MVTYYQMACTSLHHVLVRRSTWFGGLESSSILMTDEEFEPIHNWIPGSIHLCAEPESESSFLKFKNKKIKKSRANERLTRS